VSDFQEWAKSLDQAVWSKNDLNYCKQAWDTATIISESESRLRTKELEAKVKRLVSELEKLMPVNVTVVLHGSFFPTPDTV
jgi:hypothetical protein